MFFNEKLFKILELFSNYDSEELVYFTYGELFIFESLI